MPGVVYPGMTSTQNLLNRVFNNNDAQTSAASAARTTSTNFDFTNNMGSRGIVVTIDVTAVSGTPSIVFSIQDSDGLSGKFSNILSSAAVTTVSTTRLVVYPGCTASANAVANNVIGRRFRIKSVAGTSDSVTYSISHQLIP